MNTIQILTWVLLGLAWVFIGVTWYNIIKTRKLQRREKDIDGER